VLRLGFGFNPRDKGFLDVQCPAFGGSRCFIRDVQQVLALAPPGEDLLKISQIREREINVDFSRSTTVDFRGATLVDFRGLGGERVLPSKSTSVKLSMYPKVVS
jgi:hypothetical protein